MLDHTGAEGKVTKLEYLGTKKQGVVEIQSLVHEDVVIRMNASRVQLCKAEIHHSSYSDVLPENPTSQAWAIFAAVKRAICMAFQKRSGLVTFICVNSDLSRKILGFQSAQEHEQV